MLHIRKKLPAAELFRMVSGKPIASNLMECYLKENGINSFNNLQSRNYFQIFIIKTIDEFQMPI